MSEINIGARADRPVTPGVVEMVVPGREETAASPGQEECKPFFLRLAESPLGLIGAVNCCRNEALAAFPDDCDRAFDFWFKEGKDGTGWYVTGRRVGLPEVTVEVPWEKLEGSVRERRLT